MAIQLDQIVPLGRSLDEYRQMFSLTAADLGATILGVGDGPASFNAELTAQGGQVISVDPLYTFGAPQIQRRFEAVVDDIIHQVEQTPEDWQWSYHKSPADLRASRIQTMARFLEDYQTHRQSGRYVIGELPTLPFVEGQFKLALCSHLLFLYSAQLSYEFHYRSILDMLRVAQEVRLFPLLTLRGQPSPYLETLQTDLGDRGYRLRVERVAYELQKGGHHMLVITQGAARALP